MLQRLITSFIGDYNKKQIKKLHKMVHEINQRDREFDLFSDEQIKAKTAEFKQRIADGGHVDHLLTEAFAVVKQACKRMVGTKVMVKGQELTRDMVPFDEQLIGGMVLHQGRIAEMKTGEGKTLVATLPVYLNALEGKGVHVVTVNDYLASRDAEWMGHLYQRLGLSVGVVTKQVSIEQRRGEYEKDITYVENSELGFDYLRDNLTHSMDERKLLRRPMHYAIVDEVDSILIDEARTPLIISQPSGEPTEKYSHYAKIVQYLTPSQFKKPSPKSFLKEMMSDEKKVQQTDDGDYYVDEKTKTVTLSSLGIQRLEKMLNIENLYKDLGYDEIHHVENALRAIAVYHRDKDYIVVNGEILIVDEHTGRTMPGRRYSEGLHQAIEAKENVTIQRESKTLATITYQNFFKQYKKISGMTGTAATEAEEFEKIYGCEVLIVPTHRNIIRVDQNDRVYFNQQSKWQFVLDNIMFAHSVGQPILIGTASIQTSEYVSSLLHKNNIQHYVLNAKFHEQEAHIVSLAGHLGSVVVATNMAGRGTDIKLAPGLHQSVAENYAKRIQKTIAGDSFNKKEGMGVIASIFSPQEYEYTMDGLKKVLGVSDEDIRNAEKGWTNSGEYAFKVIFNTRKKSSQHAFAQLYIRGINDPSKVFEEKSFHYGLFVLGTEKHDSRRIDNQLRGRGGRQGDPGLSAFFVALDDEIMRKMGGERIQSIARLLLGADVETLELSQKQFTSSLERAQKQMEGRHFGIRKHLFDYDSVIDKQRQSIYLKRDGILIKADDEKLFPEFVAETKKDVDQLIIDVVTMVRDRFQTLGGDQEIFCQQIKQEVGYDASVSEMQQYNSVQHYAQHIIEQIKNNLHQSRQHVDHKKLSQFFKQVYLHVIDKHWIDHIDEMQYLRDKVGLYGYAQVDPLIMYKKEAFEKYSTLLNTIKQETISLIVKTDFSQMQPQQIVFDTDPLQQEHVVDMLKNASSILKSEGKKMIQPQTPRRMIDDVQVIDLSQKDTGEVQYATSKKTRPNDPCPCGSGKKYKKCHGA